MVKASPFLRQVVTPFKDNLHIEDTASKFEPLGQRLADSTDGLNIHAAIVDEVHAHKTRDMWDVPGYGHRLQAATDDAGHYDGWLRPHNALSRTTRLS